MDNHARTRHGTVTRSATGSSAAEAFIILVIATILITRLYLQLTGYPQVGGGALHIAHALYCGAFMMLALIISWLVLGSSTRSASSSPRTTTTCLLWGSEAGASLAA